LGRRFSSACLLFLLAGFATGHPFGRFGYGAFPQVPGFEIDLEGFRVAHPAADKLRFNSKATLWRPALVSDLAITGLLTGGPRCPTKLRVNLLAPGFELYFQSGVLLRFSSLSGPFLSWNEGSVGSNVPTPEVPWVMVTFRDSQPPLLLSTIGPNAAFRVDGKAGDWRLRTMDARAGWIRVSAPLGDRPYPANSAAQLGDLVRRLRPEIPFLTGPAPNWLETSIEEDPQGVVATWRFDRPGAILPAPIVLAPLAGYPLKLQSPTRRLSGANELGPVTAATEARFTVRFPVRRIPTGRSLSLGEAKWEPPATVSAIDIPTVAELAFANLTAQRDLVAKTASRGALEEYLASANYEVEPNTGQRLPYTASGRGLDLAAAHALLMQAETTAEKATSEPNSLLTSVAWRRDWYTWRVWARDQSVSRRASALAALAGALCVEKERRLDAAMFQAGLAAERGYTEWRRKNGLSVIEAKLLEPLEALRAAFFGMESKGAQAEAFLRSLQSEIRVYGDLAYSAEARTESLALIFGLREAGPRTVVLASGYPITVNEGANVTVQSVQDALGFTVIRLTPKEPGRCELLISPPTWAAPLPKAAEVPRYVESEA